VLILSNSGDFSDKNFGGSVVQTPSNPTLLLNPPLNPTSNLQIKKPMNKTKKTYTWPTVYRAELKAATGLGDDWIEKNILKGLPRGIYFFTLPGSNRVLYNLDLIRDFLVNGDCPAHQKSVQRWLASLPSSDVA
jgi:hypothetical protein